MLSLARLADGLLAVLLAPACAACDAPLSHPSRGPVCDACWNAIGRFTPPLCGRCGDPLPSWRVLDATPRRERLPAVHDAAQSALTGSRAIGAYDGSLRAIVHAFKYEGCRSLSARPGRAPARERRRPSRAPPTSWFRCRSTAAGGGRAASTRRASWRRGWACRWSMRCGESARRRRRPTSRPPRGTATCGTRLRSGAGDGTCSTGCGSSSWTT